MPACVAKMCCRGTPWGQPSHHAADAATGEMALALTGAVALRPQMRAVAGATAPRFMAVAEGFVSCQDWCLRSSVCRADRLHRVGPL